MSARNRHSKGRSNVSRRGDRAATALGPRNRVRLPIWKKLLFSLVTCVAFFVVLELVLLACGVRPVLYDDDPYVGFAAHIPLFVEQEGADGRTYLCTAENKRRFFNDQEFPKEKAAGTTRIFCMGGSTTFGRPYDDTTSFCGWLRELLPAADPSRHWELVNAGGISYASYRVASLMEEIAAYEPDLFIIYCGHNEFLERRTYSGIIETPPAVRGLGAMLSRTRTYAAMSRLFGAAGGRRRDETSPPLLPAEVETVLDNSVGPDQYTRDEQLQRQVLAHYRYNLVRMVQIARAAGAGVIFVTPASNLRHATPFKSEHREGLTDAQQQQWQSLLQRADAAYEAGEFGQSLAALDEAAGIDDQHAGFHYLRGRVLDGLGRFPEAKAAYRRAADCDVCPLRALSSMREILAEVASQWDVPLVDFARLIEDKSPDGIPGKEWFLDHVHPTIEGHRALALALIDEMAEDGMVTLGPSWGDAAVARVAQQVEARTDRKEHGRALRNLAQVLSWAGKTEDAYRTARKAVELAPSDAEANYLVASLAQKLGHQDVAIRHYRILLRADLDPQIAPYVVNAHYQYGSILAWQEKFEEAEEHLRKALATKPDHPQAGEELLAVLLAQGRRLLQAGQPQLAVEKLQEVIRAQEDHAEACNYLGVALLQLDRLPEAVAYLEKAVAAKPDYAEAHNNLGTAEAMRGDAREAEVHYREAIRIRPGYAEALRNLGNLRLEESDCRDAEICFRQAIAAQPTRAELHYRLGLALDGQGKTADAAKAYLDALKLDPHLAAAHNKLGVALANLGNLDAAERELRRATELDAANADFQNDLQRILDRAKQPAHDDKASLP